MFSVKLNPIITSSLHTAGSKEHKTLESPCIVVKKDCNFMHKILFSVMSKSVLINYASEWSSFWSCQEQFFLSLESNISIFSKKV